MLDKCSICQIEGDISCIIAIKAHLPNNFIASFSWTNDTILTKSVHVEKGIGYVEGTGESFCAARRTTSVDDDIWSISRNFKVIRSYAKYLTAVGTQKARVVDLKS